MSRVRPDDDEKPFIARWNAFIRVLLVDPSVKHVARAAAADYADFYDGTSCRPSSSRLARELGYDERTVRMAWGHLRAMGLADRVTPGIAHKGVADEYELKIPYYWDSMAILGPNSRKFTCLACGKVFNPPPAGRINDNGDAVWDLWKLCFCKPPRKTKGRAGIDCWTAWNTRRKSEGQPVWRQLDNETSWKLFREARADDW